MSKNLISTLMDKAMADANLVSMNLTDEYLGVYTFFLEDIANMVPRFHKPHKDTLLHFYIRGLLVCGCLYDDIIENEPRYYWEKCHDETLFRLFHHSLSEAGTIPSADYSDDIAFAESVNTFYCDYINDEWANHVFYVLYSNKDFLFRFSSEIARVVQTLKKDDYPQHLKSDGVIKRKAFPPWLIKGVNARDRYHCQLCGKELSGGLYPTSENYDHIIPLELGGTNDATNIQLTCESCNKRKGARNMDYKNIIIPFW